MSSLTSLSLSQGGYNLSSISKSMAMCTSMLLGDPPPALITPLPPPHHSAVATINEIIRYHAPYWRSLRIHSQYIIIFFIYCLFFTLNTCLLFCSVPDAVRASLPSPKRRGKRSSRGTGRKSEESSMSKPSLSLAAQLDTLVVKSF